MPTVDQEAARDLVRAREDCRSDLMRARHRLSKLLLRHGIVYFDGAAWTGKHEVWLRQQRLDTPAARMAFDSDFDAMLVTNARRNRLDHAIAHCETFFNWYNNEHHHTGIGLLTPHHRHAGNGPAVYAARQTVLEAPEKSFVQDRPLRPALEKPA